MLCPGRSIPPVRRSPCLAASNGCQHEIDRFLSTGDYDVLHAAWPGGHALERIERGSADLQQALLVELRRREATVTVPRDAPIGTDDLVAFSREKLRPMVNGLFRRDEREAVLAVLEKSVVFLSPENIEALIRAASLSTAWTISSMYLRSIGASPISEHAPKAVGLFEETTCYVSLEYFTDSVRGGQPSKRVEGDTRSLLSQHDRRCSLHVTFDP